MMRIAKFILCVAGLTPACLFAQEIKVTPLLSRDLTEFPGKEGTMITVVYPPGGSETIHRHNAHVFVYVLQGSVVMQVRGGKEMILTAGHTFYESPSDIHVIGRNASKTEPAQFIAFFVKDKGAPTHIPAK
jgi:quercetin dioxygenase-like cupin family protein